MRAPTLSIALLFLSLWSSPSHANDVASVAGETAALEVSPSFDDHALKTQRMDELVRALSDHTLAFEEMYLKMYSSMSMKNGKGKGKDQGQGGSKSSKMGGSSNMGGSSKGGMSSKSSKKSKGSKTSSKGSKTSSKGDKASKKSKNSKDDGTMAPTVTAMPSPTPGSPTPPAKSPTEPVPTFSPNTDGTTVTVTPYSLFYTIEQTRIPNLDDYSELGMFTSEYLNVYFQVIFGDDSAAEFVTSVTEVTGSEFRLGQPTRVDFTTSMTFVATSETVPPLTDLDTFLRSAFEGANADTYVTAVAEGLPETNIFATTTEVTFEAVAADGGTTERRVGIISGAAAVVFVLLLGGAIASHNRDKEVEEVQQKLIAGGGGHVTVAGETYHDDASLETHEQTQNSGEDDDSTIYSSSARSRASRWSTGIMGDRPPPRHRLATVPPDFEDDSFVDSGSDSDWVDAVSRDERKETPAERQTRLETVAL